MAIRTISYGEWIFYLSNNGFSLDKNKCGKWMYFFQDRMFIEKICKEAIINGIVQQCKHNDSENGVSCFYINGDDIDCHKKVISFFMENDLIRKTKAGKFYNIAFKYDNQTRAGEYGNDFKGEIKLADFIDLNTGKWI